MIRIEDYRRRLVSRILACSSLDCVLEALDDAALYLGPEGLRTLLRDERVLAALHPFSISRDALAGRVGSGDYRALKNQLDIVLEAFEAAARMELPPLPEAALLEVRERLLTSLSFCRTPDCALIKLGSAVAEIRDLARYGPWSVRGSLRRLLSDPRVGDRLSRLFPRRPSTYVAGDPRHSILQPYTDILDEMIEPGAEPVAAEEEELDVDFEEIPVERLTLPEPHVEPGQRHAMEEARVPPEEPVRGRGARGPGEALAGGGEARGRRRGPRVPKRLIATLLVFSAAAYLAYEGALDWLLRSLSGLPLLLGRVDPVLAGLAFLFYILIPFAIIGLGESNPLLALLLMAAEAAVGLVLADLFLERGTFLASEELSFWDLAAYLTIVMNHEFMHAAAYWAQGCDALPIPILIPPVLGLTVAECPLGASTRLAAAAPLLVSGMGFLLAWVTGDDTYLLLALFNLFGMLFDFIKIITG